MSGKNLLPFNLSWAFTIHKSQGKTLELLVIDLGAGEKYSGFMLVALSRFGMVKHFLLKLLDFKELRKVNTYSGLIDIKNDLPALEQNSLDTRLK